MQRCRRCLLYFPAIFGTNPGKECHETRIGYKAAHASFIMIKPFVVLVTLLVIFDPASGFRLNDYQHQFDNGDHTVTSIIYQGLLQAIVGHVIKINPGLAPGPPHSDLTETVVLEWIYGELAPTEKLASAITAIIEDAMLICVNPNWINRIGFLEDTIHEGHQMLQSLRGAINDKLVYRNASDSSGTRALIGTYLCGLISFYSNTNWVPSFVIEGEIKTYRTLGMPGANIEHYVAEKDYPTCRSCWRSGVERCRENLITGSGILTSIYRDEHLPPSSVIGASHEGKCGQGYFSGDLLVNGGIDKSSRDQDTSPHWFYHDQAGKIAIQAIVEFFIDDLLGLFPNGDPNLNVFMGLQRGRDLLFTIDTTGSMKDEINAVSERTIEIAEKSAGSPDAPRTYTIVEFNDPVVKPAFTTANVSTFVAEIDRISVDGGGDCPEMAMSGMLEAINAAESARSTLFVFTDAPAKDENKEEAVITRANSKGVSIIIFVAASSGCGMDVEANKALYRRVAEKTGGELFFSNSDADFTNLLSLIDERSRGGLSTIYKKTVTKLETLTFYVDTTVKTLLVVVSSEQRITQTVQLRLESTGELVNATLVTATLIIFQVTSAGYGVWSLSVTGGSSGNFSLEVSVTGQTGTTVSFEMYQDAGDGTVKPITGTPDAGTKVTVRINFHGTNVVAALHLIKLISASSELIANYTAYLKRDGSGVATIVYPDEPFTIEVEAEDRSGNAINRVDTTVRGPAELKLKTNDTSVRLLTNQTKIIVIMVQNRADMQRTYNVFIEDKDHIVYNVSYHGNVPANGLDNITVLLFAHPETRDRHSTPTFSVVTTDGARASLLLGVVITDPPPPIVIVPKPTTSFPSGAEKARLGASVISSVLISITMAMVTIR